MNIHTFVISQAFAVLTLVSLHVSGAEVDFPQCPKTLPIQQVIQIDAENAWKIVNSSYSHHLQYIGISYGEYLPENGGMEIPVTKKHPKYTIAHYDTSPSTSGEHNLWAVCSYMNSAAVLIQKLPENVVRCEVKYMNDATVPDRVTIKCFDTARKTK